MSMLIKDITLRDAIGDLVDNAVDAIKACAEDKNDLSGYKVVVTLDENEFTKAQVVDAIREFIPNFEHEEKGKNLDQKM